MQNTPQLQAATSEHFLSPPTYPLRQEVSFMQDEYPTPKFGELSPRLSLLNISGNGIEGLRFDEDDNVFG